MSTSSASDADSYSSSDEEVADVDAADDDEVHIPDELRLRIGSGGVSALQFHPTDASLLAIGTTDGRLRLYRTEHQRVACVARSRCFGSLRRLAFVSPADGTRLVSCSSAGGVKLHDSATGRLLRFYRRAHRTGIGALAALDEQRFVCADDDDQLSLWDARQPAPVFRLDLKAPAEEGESVEPAGFAIGGVTDCVVDAAARFVYCAGADGTVCTVNLRRRRLELRSEFFGAGLSSACLAKSGRKLVVGAEDGYLNLLDTAELQTANLSDRVPVLKRSGRALPPVECLAGPLGVRDDLLLAGCADGSVRAVRLLPHKWLGVVGQLDGHEAAAADCMSCAVDAEQSLLAVSSPDSAVVRFWGVAELVAQADQDAADGEAVSSDEDDGGAATRRRKAKPVKSSEQKLARVEHHNGTLGAASFFADIC